MRTFSITTKTEHAAHILMELAAMDALTINSESSPVPEMDEQTKEERLKILKGLYGSVSKEAGEALDKHLKEIRNEWSHRDI